jgi:hypothetical protein
MSNVNMPVKVKAIIDYGKVMKELGRNDSRMQAEMQLWWDKMVVDAMADMAKVSEEMDTRRRGKQRKPRRIQEVEEFNVEDLTPAIEPAPEKKKPKKKKARKPKPEPPRKRDKWETVKV